MLNEDKKQFSFNVSEYLSICHCTWVHIYFQLEAAVSSEPCTVFVPMNEDIDTKGTAFVFDAQPPNAMNPPPLVQLHGQETRLCRKC